MYKNNFTRPEENRPALELQIFYDTEASGILFNSYITVLQYDSNGASLAAYQCSPETLGEIVNLKSLKKSELTSLAKMMDWYDESTKEDLMDDLEDVKIKSPFIPICKIIKEYSSEYDYMVTRGYCQGDVCVVLFKKDNKPSSEFINNLFWDSPVYANLAIDGEDFHLDKYLEDAYIYDREKLLEKLKPDLSEYVFEWLSRNLPKHLEYM